MPLYPSYPEIAHRALMWHDEVLVTVGGPGLTIVTASTHPHNTLPFVATGTNGDEFTNSFFVKEGTYTLYILGQTANNRGLIDWYVDGVVKITGQDWYSAGTTVNVLKSGSLGVLTDGHHILTGRVNGKNASSLAHFIVLTSYWVKQATD